MMTTRTTEIWVGLFVAGGLAALFMLAMRVSNLSAYSGDNGFDVTAVYEDASGLKVRSPVTMAGVTIGRVTQIRFDPLWDVLLKDGKVIKQLKTPATADVKTTPKDNNIENLTRRYVAVVTLHIQGQYDKQIPDSSDANVYTAGLLGEKYIGILPGAVTQCGEDEELSAALEGKPEPAIPSTKNCNATHFLTQGSLIRKTQGTLVLEKLIAQFIDKFSSSK
ncbi:MAG: outer membrane lipid asymmetry maintenance protein MlaD [Gammaproteobacteria bacterium]|nr:outer membrane lipid asymmetry maintenance protein MlaD [Gammaproteobacteria bacterium]